MQRKVALVRAAAAPRARQPVLDVLVQHLEITCDREQAAEAFVAEVEGLDVATALETPFVLLGTPEEIAGQVRVWETRLGATSWVVRPPQMQAAAQVMQVLQKIHV